MPAALQPPQAERRAEAIGRTIFEAFEDYHARFSEITHRAKARFEQRDWSGAREDAVERIALYDQCIGECMLRLRAVLLGQARRPRAVDPRARAYRPRADFSFQQRAAAWTVSQQRSAQAQRRSPMG